MLAPDLQTSTAGPSCVNRCLHDDAPQADISVEVVCDFEDLQSRELEWQRLVDTAIEPNVFFEPTFLLPAMKHLAQGNDIQLVLLYAASKANPSQRVLCGMFPLQRRGQFRDRTVPGISTWLHKDCFLGTPLVRSDAAGPTLHALMDWLSSEGRPRTMLFHYIHASGPFAIELAAVLQQRGTVSFIQKQLARAQYQPYGSATEFMQQVWSSRTRTKTRRQQRQLAQLGEVQFRQLQPNENCAPWLQAFLELEACGWKGKNGSAMDCSEKERNYFVESLTADHAEGRLHMLALELDGRPIAMNTVLYTSNGGYVFKIAYDESLAKYSPGVLLEAEFLRVAHARPGLEWLDSCADPNHPMIERLWDQRRLIQSTWVSAGGFTGDLLIVLYSLLNSLNRCRVRWTIPWVQKLIRRR